MSSSSSSSSSSTAAAAAAAEEASASLLDHDETGSLQNDFTRNPNGHYVNMEDEGGGSDFENNEIAAIEQQFAAMESRGNRRGEGVLGEDRGWNQFQVFYGDSLIPEESVTLIGLMKSDLFYFNCYAFAIIAILSVSLKVDWKRAQSEMKLLAIWAVINVLIHVIMFLVNYMAVALFTNYSSAIRNNRKFKIYVIVCRLLYFVWFAWFVFGAVLVFRTSRKSYRFKAPILFTSLYGITNFNLFFLAIILVFFVFGFILERLRTRRAYQRISDGVAEDTRALNTETIKDLPTVKYTKNMMDDVDATCGICLSEYQEGEVLKYLPCHHHFHLECIETWLISNKTCPYCKHPADKPLDEEAQENYTNYHTGPSTGSATTTTSTTASTTNSN